MKNKNENLIGLLRIIFGDYQITNTAVEILREYESNLICALAVLSQRERRVIIDRFIYDRTLQECAEFFGVTRERIRQVEAKAFRKLRHPARVAIIETGFKRQLHPQNRLIRKTTEADPLQEILFSTRVINCLRNAGIVKMSELTKLSRDDLLKLSWLGRKGVAEIEEELALCGYYLKTISWE